MNNMWYKRKNNILKYIIFFMKNITDNKPADSNSIQ